MRRLLIVPCGEIGAGLPGRLAGALPRLLPFEVTVGEALAVPAGAYHPRRRQYLASELLVELRRQAGGRPEPLLAVTDVDIFAPGLSFVFGLADRRAAAAVISLARLRPEFYGGKPDPALGEKRALKEAVHEAGHLLGLPHCQAPGCIMRFSSTVAETDAKGPGFCSACHRRVFP